MVCRLGRERCRRRALRLSCERAGSAPMRSDPGRYLTAGGYRV